MKYCEAINTKLTLTNRTDPYEVDGMVKDQKKSQNGENRKLKRRRCKKSAGYIEEVFRSL
jgi:hypothetical protein